MPRRCHLSPEASQKLSEAMKRRRADPEFIAKQKAAAAKNMRRLHANPEFAAAHVERSSKRMKRLNADPEFAAGLKKQMKQRHADPEFASETRERLKRLHADPAFKARLKAAQEIPPEKQKAVLEALRENLNAVHASKKTGVSVTTVYKIGHRAGITFKKGQPRKSSRTRIPEPS